MFGWGQSEDGQLGLGGIPDVEVSCPRLVSDISLDSGVFIRDVKAGNSHSIILSSDGKVHSCGSNEFGQVHFLKINTLNTYILTSYLLITKKM